jgi:hypothetical protein
MKRSPQAVLTLLSIVFVSIAVEKVTKKALRKGNRRKRQAPAAEVYAAEVLTPVSEDKAGIDSTATVIVDAVCAEDSSESSPASDVVTNGPSGQMALDWQLLLLNALAAIQELTIFCVCFAVSATFWPYSPASLMTLFLAGPIVLDLHSKWSRALDNALSKPIWETPVKAWDQA